MQNVGRWIADPKVRGWLYNIGLAIVALLIGYGIINAVHGGLWITLIAAVLGSPLALARANVPPRE